MSETVLKVGNGEQYTTINSAILAADNMGGNADIQVDAGTYVNDGGYLWDGVDNVTIEGVGGTVTLTDPNYNAGGKAAIVTGGQNILLKNLDISGVQVSDANGAAIRYDQGSLTLDNVHLHDNQNGILSAGDSSGSITIENSVIDHNGVGGNGHTHDIYIGDVANFTLTNSIVTDAETGHEVKSRAQNTTITNNVIADDSETASYTIDLPNGGNATITGNTIEQGALTQNSAINAYGEEGASNSGNAVTFSNNTVINDGPDGALWSGGGGNFTGSGNNYYNVGSLGQAGSVGYTTDGSRPALNIGGYVNSTPVSTRTDTIALSLSEDAWQGDAKADILVDGVAVMRDQTITASHTAGQDQKLTFAAPSAASHVVSVAFTNDAWDGTAANDRNLYIDGISVNGVSTGQSAPEDGGGIESFIVNGSGASGTTTTASGSSSDNTTPSTGSSSGSTPTQPTGTGPTDQGSAGTGTTSTPTQTLPTPGTATFGTGSDQIVLHLSEDAYQGNAVMAIRVDGQQLTDDYEVQSLHSAGQDDTITLDVAPAANHDLQVTFTNDKYDGTPSTDRNAYVDSVSANGQTVGGATAAMDSAGTIDFTVPGTAPATSDGSTDSSSGSGGPGTTSSSTPHYDQTPAADAGYEKIDLALSEDAYQGDAQVALSIDGFPQGSPITLDAAHGTGATNWVEFDVWAAQGHTINVDFLNDDYAGTPSTDRNAYVDQVYVNGQATGQSLTLLSQGTQSITIPPAPTNTSTAGQDTVVLSLSEDAYQGDAEFTVSVNGQRVDGTYTATASNTNGLSQAISIPATLGSGANTVGITFLNDAYDGSVSTDRNLYLDSATVNGVTVSGRETLLSNGAANFSFNASNPTPVATSTLVLNVAEDAWQGDAQMVVSVDGKEMGFYTATASQAAGQSQAITISNIPESFNPHDIAVSFVNDAYGGSSSTDRNLYLNSTQFDGQTVSGGSATYMSDGTQHFTATAPVNWVG